MAAPTPGAGGSPYMVNPSYNPNDPANFNSMPGQYNPNYGNPIGQFGGDYASLNSYLNQGATPPAYADNGTSNLMNNLGNFVAGISNAATQANQLASNQYKPVNGPGTPFVDQFANPRQFPPGYLGIENNFGQATPPAQPTFQDQLWSNLQDQLAGIQGQGNQDFSQQANQQAAVRYDPLIQQLQIAEANAKTNEGTASQRVGDLYNSLGRALAAQIPVVTNQFNNAEDQSKQNYQNLQNSITANYQNAQDQQAAQLQKLGIQAALPQSTQGLQRDQQYLTNQANVNGQALNSALQTMGQGQADFVQRLSQLAPMAGSNLQADLAQKLLELQNTYENQIAGYKNQEGALAQSLLGQLQTAAQTNIGKETSQAISDAMNTAKFAQLINPTVFGRITGTPLAKTATSKTGPYQNVESLVNQNTQDPNEQTKLMGLFNSMLNSDVMNQGPQAGQQITPTAEYNLMLQAAQSQGQQLSPGEQQQLLNMALAYNKKY